MLFQGAATTFVRYFSRSRRPNLRKINPKVPPQEASSIAKDLHQIIKEKGPLTVPKTWDHVKVSSFPPINLFFAFPISTQRSILLEFEIEVYEFL